MTTVQTDWKLALKQLRQFQDYTLKIQALDQQLAAIAERRAEAHNRLAGLKEQWAGKGHDKERIEQSRRADELEVEVEKVHLQEKEAKLYAIKTNKEYQAALKEVADSKRLIREREDRVLSDMESLEKLTQEITQLSTTVADTESECATLATDLDAQTATVRADHQREHAARETVAGTVAKEAMKIYKNAQRRFPDALGPVEHGVCCGCNMRIPPQLFVELQQYKRLYDCPSCHRILYVDVVEKN